MQFVHSGLTQLDNYGIIHNALDKYGIMCPAHRHSAERFNMTKYSVFSEDGESPDGERYVSYGIEIKTEDSVKLIHDVTSDRKRIYEFVSMLKRYEASPIHILDLIEDFFYCSFA